ncbi:exopolyphosphatase [Neisseria gonorrhoeae]|uniref:Exopolyphosphatase n=1 Tax=Neisseria gonorrhoeae TaxID=485 RepID=A0A378VXJ3_NEIGO|nr:exopolyphosphatase [Neisseria gonorrhoeae]
MMAAFEEMKLDRMTVTEAALRDGVFYDLIGRGLNEDMRGQTVAEFQHRYHVSLNQAKRTAETAQTFMDSLCHAKTLRFKNLPCGNSISDAPPRCMKSVWTSPTPAITSIPPTSSKTPICRVFHARNRPYLPNWSSVIAAI